MKIVFFTFYFPPDLSAGSFRALPLAEELSTILDKNDELHILTTQPQRYKSYNIKAKDFEKQNNIIIHRINVPNHKNNMFSQMKTFLYYAVSSYKMCYKIKPNFLFGTTGRLMTGLLTGMSANRLKINYFIDIRDIFSETISDYFNKKNKFLGFFLKKIFSFLEKLLLNNASGVNVVSESFLEYYKKNKINTINWSFYPNGVDEEFTKLKILNKNKIKKSKTILYAGNIGAAQALDQVLPAAAKYLGNDYKIIVIGDGSSKNILIETINKMKVNNIEILKPMDRQKLLKYYKKADILFLHLNDIPAFKRVLPSKIFEYAVIKKPIIAGVSGYSAKFIKTHIQHAFLFKPNDIQGFVNILKKADNVVVDLNNIEAFISKFSRKKIMKNLSMRIFQISQK